MQLNDHARILFAYLARLTIADRNAIVETMKDADYASLNLGTSAQCDAQRRTTEAIEAAVRNMTDRDRELIAEVIRNAGR